MEIYSGINMNNPDLKYFDMTPPAPPFAQCIQQETYFITTYKVLLWGGGLFLKITFLDIVILRERFLSHCSFKKKNWVFITALHYPKVSQREWSDGQWKQHAQSSWKLTTLSSLLPGIQIAHSCSTSQAVPAAHRIDSHLHGWQCAQVATSCVLICDGTI